MSEGYTNFVLTEEHLKLLKASKVDWNSYATGAPTISPERPYGNNSIHRDMIKILGWKVSFSVNDGTLELFDFDKDIIPETLERTLTHMHRELETALQICLYTGEFEAGTYQSKNYTSAWIKV